MNTSSSRLIWQRGTLNVCTIGGTLRLRRNTRKCNIKYVYQYPILLYSISQSTSVDVSIFIGRLDRKVQDFLLFHALRFTSDSFIFNVNDEKDVTKRFVPDTSIFKSIIGHEPIPSRLFLELLKFEIRKRFIDFFTNLRVVVFSKAVSKPFNSIQKLRTTSILLFCQEFGSPCPRKPT